MKTLTTNAAAMARRLRRRRVAVAAMAVILSLAGHVMLAVYFPSVSWLSPDHGLPQAEDFPQRPRFDVDIQPDDWIRTVATMDYLRLAARAPLTEATAPVTPDQRFVDPAIFEPERSPEELLADEMLLDQELVPRIPDITVGPGQEIIQITERIVAEPREAFARMLTPSLKRVSAAPDIVVPGVEDEIRRRATTVSTDRPHEADWTPGTGEGLMGPSAAVRLGDVTVPARRLEIAEITDRTVSDFLAESREAITPVTAVDRFLKIRAWKYSSARDRQHVYVALAVERHSDQAAADEDFLDVLPKDVFFIQDLSGSMGERRVDACRESIRLGLQALSPHDRFNIVTFAHEPEQYSENWVTASDAGIRAVQPFLAAMQSGGMTDIDAALNRIMEIERDPVRPTLAVMLTDGIPTAGVTNSTRIIEDFTVRNRGAISMFAVAAADASIANMYLLDMLTYRNRGDARVLDADRHEIPDLTDSLCREFARPVLTDLRYRFTRDSDCEAYPIMLSHLYLDRPLVLYGRIPRDRRNLVFQVIGRSGEKLYDFVFDLALEDLAPADEGIRLQWARHRMYALIGEHMRTDDPRLLRDLFDTANRYGVEIPYLDDFSPPGRLRWW